jgi:hypothetical protein
MDKLKGRALVPALAVAIVAFAAVGAAVVATHEKHSTQVAASAGPALPDAMLQAPVVKAPPLGNDTRVMGAPAAPSPDAASTQAPCSGAACR